MVTVWPLLAVTVAVAMVTTVCPAGMVVTRLAWQEVLAMAATAVLVVLTGLEEVTEGSPSTKRRLRKVPTGGEL